MMSQWELIFNAAKLQPKLRETELKSILAEQKDYISNKAMKAKSSAEHSVWKQIYNYLFTKEQ